MSQGTRGSGTLHLIAVDIGVPEELRLRSPSMHHRDRVDGWIELDAVTSMDDGVARLLSAHAAFDQYLDQRQDAEG